MSLEDGVCRKGSVAVTGSRRLGERARPLLRQAMDALLFALPPGTLYTPLAEGADRLAAQAALEQGWRIAPILPFAQATYEQDFAAPVTPGTTPAACLAEFRALLAAAAEVTVLDHPRHPDPRPGYEAAGRAVVERADLLLAIWDGVHTGKRGGTSETMRYAAAIGRPILWLHSDGTQPARLIQSLPAFEHPHDLPEALPWLASR
jgi:hypothetical protein